MRTLPPSRGEIWTCDFGIPVGHEQGSKRPCLVISVDDFNHGPAELAAVMPCTSAERMVPWHIRIEPPEGGVSMVSYVLCDQIRVVSFTRFIKCLGSVGNGTVSRVESMLRVFLDL